MAKRRIWLIASMLAVFGLQVPLCALACMQGSDAESIAAAEIELPCHGPGPSGQGQTHEQSGTPASSEVPCSQQDCGCEFVYEALPPSADGVSNAGGTAFLLVGTPGQPLESRLARASRAPTSTNLPPPDILLLKSTLLI